MTTHFDLAGQLPYRLQPGSFELCEWLSNNEQGFTEPFFADTIIRLRTAGAKRQKRTCVSEIAMLPKWAAGLGAPYHPGALIFHVSRCGSTLLAQLLALQQENMVLSEVPFFDELLRLPFKGSNISTRQAAQMMDAALQIYAYSSAEKPNRIFIKAESWHLHFYKQLRQLYPHTAFILLYRDPWQVLQSQQRRRGMQSVPGMIEPALFNFTPLQADEYDLDRYMSHVLHSYFKQMAYISKNDANSILINYNEGMPEGFRKLANSAGLPITDVLWQQVKARVAFHSKYPQELFCEETSVIKPPGYLDEVYGLYHQLENIRTIQSGSSAL